MLYFVDLEFDVVSSEKIDLVSVGVVNANSSFYAELPPKRTWASNFVDDTVAPLLGQDSRNIYRSVSQMGNALKMWLESTRGTSKAVLVCDSDQDKVLLTKQLELSCEINVISKSMLDDDRYIIAHDSYFDPVLKPQHHALHDANAIMLGYVAVMGKM